MTVIRHTSSLNTRPNEEYSRLTYLSLMDVQNGQKEVKKAAPSRPSAEKGGRRPPIRAETEERENDTPEADRGKRGRGGQI